MILIESFKIIFLHVRNVFCFRAANKIICYGFNNCSFKPFILTYWLQIYIVKLQPNFSQIAAKLQPNCCPSNHFLSTNSEIIPFPHNTTLTLTNILSFIKLYVEVETKPRGRLDILLYLKKKFRFVKNITLIFSITTSRNFVDISWIKLIIFSAGFLSPPRHLVLGGDP